MSEIVGKSGFNVEICRICLSSDKEKECIFRENENDDRYANILTDISLKLQICGGVEILKNDGLPDSICIQCVAKVNAAHEFRELCQSSDAKLRKLYGKTMGGSVTVPVKMKNQYSQTDNFVPVDSIKIEEDIMGNNDFLSKFDVRNSGECKVSLRYNANRNLQCSDIKLVESEYDAVSESEKKEFQQVICSKNCTEIHRKCIKKNTDQKEKYSKKESEYNNLRNNVVHECSMHNKCSKKILNEHASKCMEESNCQKCEKNRLHSKIEKRRKKFEYAQCQICHKNFRKIDTMIRHLNVHKKTNPKDVSFILKEIQDKRKSDGKIIIDDISNRENEERNESALNGENYSCEAEVSNSNSNSDFIDGALPYRCTHCTKSYSSERSLRRHVSIHEEKRFVCRVCDMKFFRKDYLENHQDKYGHDKDTPSTEPDKPPDDKTESMEKNLKRQMMPHDTGQKSFSSDENKFEHPTDSNKVGMEDSKVERTYSCDECGKSFEKEIKLQRHKRIHERAAKERQDSSFKRFLCHVCSKTFRQNTGLVFHMRTHTGYKPHVCKYCGRGFTSNSNCINHERTHTGDRPFVCHFCSAAFAKSCTLKAHITTHTGEANYHCKTCGKSFRRLKYLKEHRFTHTGEKPYACKICGTAYSHSGSLFVHEKKCKAQYNYQDEVPEARTNGNYSRDNYTRRIIANHSAVSTFVTPNFGGVHANSSVPGAQW